MRNPVTTMLWYLGAIFATMLCPVPVVTFSSLAAAVAVTVIQAGPAAAASQLRWQLLLLALIVLVNPLFASVGQTPLLELGPYRLTAESALYGLVMGAMLLASLLWFSALFRAVTQDQIVDMVSVLSPTVGLMLGLVMRFVGQSVARISAQARLDRANTALAQAADKNAAGQALDTLTMLLGYVLDRALTQGEYMKALGWGLKPRTSWRAFPVSRADAVRIAAFCVLAVAAVVAGSLVARYFTFYPVVSHPGQVALLGRFSVPFGALYAPVVAMVAAPLALAAGEEYAWAHR
jgi:energy-coupling factor transport system permease protein